MKNLISLILLLFSNFSYSLPINEIEIGGEKITNCSLSHESVDAALSSVARYNRINIKGTSYVMAYHQVNALPIQNNSCAANLYFDIRVYDSTRVLGKNIFTKIVLCSNSFILTGDISGMQTRLNNAAKEAFELCLVEVEKK